MSEHVNSYPASFGELLEAEGHDRIENYLTASVFDEVPLFSREAQLGFLGNVSRRETNRLIIRATVLHQRKIDELARKRFSGRSDPFRRMVSITGWWDVDWPLFRSVDVNSTLLTPNFWVGNMASPEVAHFEIIDGTSESSEFVSDALEGLAGLKIFEGWSQRSGERLLSRVYVTAEKLAE